MSTSTVNGIIYTIINGSAIVGKDNSEEHNALVDEKNTKRVYIESYVNEYIVLTIGKYAFRFSRVEYIFIPKTIEILKLDSLAYMKELKTVEFEEDSSLKTLEQGVFYNSTNLKELHLPSRVQTVKNSVFEGTNIDFLYYYGMFEIIEDHAFTYTVSTPPKHLYACKNAPFNHFAELENNKLEKLLNCPQNFKKITHLQNHIIFELSHYITHFFCL